MPRAPRKQKVGAVAVAGAVLVAAGVLESRATLVVGVCALAAVSTGLMAWRSKNIIWLLSSIIAMCMMSSTIIENAFGDIEAAHWGWQTLRLTLFSATATLITIGFWIGGRPFLSWHPSRRAAHFVSVGIVAALVGVVMLETSKSSRAFAGAFRTLSVGPFLVAIAFVGVSGFVLWRALRQLDRGLELTIVIGTLGHLVIHSVALVADDLVSVDWARFVSMSSLVVASHRRDSALVGRVVAEEQTLIEARPWSPLIAIAGVLGSAMAFRSGAPGEVVVGGVLLSLGLAAFAAREMAGPRKPIVVPFGRRDRAFQRLAGDLVDGDVRLWGRPVIRTSDGVTVGIESVPQWSGGADESFPIETIAKEVELSELLDRQILDVACAHLPGVIHALGGDEPWLSVPVGGGAPPAFSEGDGTETLDGLVLRFGALTAEHDHEVLKQWRDRGAWVQIDQSSVAADDERLDPEIVAVDTSRHSKVSPAAMVLLRVDDPEARVAEMHRLGAFYAVNRYEALYQFSHLLSPAGSVTENQESVRPVHPPGPDEIL